jgi:predicted protein tyrosine phosphatase
LAFRYADEGARLLIHCHAGISRSRTATLMILAQAHPHEEEDAIAEPLIEITP